MRGAGSDPRPYRDVRPGTVSLRPASQRIGGKRLHSKTSLGFILLCFSLTGVAASQTDSNWREIQVTASYEQVPTASVIADVAQLANCSVAFESNLELGELTWHSEGVLWAEVLHQIARLKHLEILLVDGSVVVRRAISVPGFSHWQREFGPHNNPNSRGRQPVLATLAAVVAGDPGLRCAA